MHSNQSCVNQPCAQAPTWCKLVLCHGSCCHCPIPVPLSGCPGQPGVSDTWGIPSGNALRIPAGVSSYPFYIQLLVWLETCASCQLRGKWQCALSNKWPRCLFSVSRLFHSMQVTDPGAEHPQPSRKECSHPLLCLGLELTCFTHIQTAGSPDPWNNQFIVTGIVHLGFHAVVSTSRAKGLFVGCRDQVRSRVAVDGNKQLLQCIFFLCLLLFCLLCLLLNRLKT